MINRNDDSGWSENVIVCSFDGERVERRPYMGSWSGSAKIVAYTRQPKTIRANAVRIAQLKLAQQKMAARS